MIPSWKGKMCEALVGPSLLQSQHVLHLPHMHFQSLTAFMQKTHLILLQWPAPLRGIPCAQKDCLAGKQQGLKGRHEQT